MSYSLYTVLITNKDFFNAPFSFSVVLISQITQVLEGKKTKSFESIQIPDDYKVGVNILYKYFSPLSKLDN